MLDKLWPGILEDDVPGLSSKLGRLGIADGLFIRLSRLSLLFPLLWLTYTELLATPGKLTSAFSVITLLSAFYLGTIGFI